MSSEYPRMPRHCRPAPEMAGEDTPLGGRNFVVTLQSISQAANDLYQLTVKIGNCSGAGGNPRPVDGNHNQTLWPNRRSGGTPGSKEAGGSSGSAAAGGSSGSTGAMQHAPAPPEPCGKPGPQEPCGQSMLPGRASFSLVAALPRARSSSRSTHPVPRNRGSRSSRRVPRGSASDRPCYACRRRARSPRTSRPAPGSPRAGNSPARSPSCSPSPRTRWW